jgi:hypothetical protein
MVSLPELKNGLRYWLEIRYTNNVWKTRGPHAQLPTRECPQMTQFTNNNEKHEMIIFKHLDLDDSLSSSIFKSVHYNQSSIH